MPKKSLVVSGFILAIFLFISSFLVIDSWKPWNLPLSGKTIVLDPGHGGMDGGATKSGISEKEITLRIVQKVRDYLQEQGALVILTRQGDKDVSTSKTADLQHRANIINQSGADFFTSIHLNAFPMNNIHGAQTFYYGNLLANEKAATLIQEELRKNLSKTTRVAKQIQNIYLLKEAKIPGVLVEAGFLSNDKERSLLQTNTYQNKIAEAIYIGILRYYTAN